MESKKTVHRRPFQRMADRQTIRYIVRRLMYLVPMLLLILVITFGLVRFLPGDPARLQLGPLAPEEGVQALRKEMKLDKTVVEQFSTYVNRVIHGDFGRSWVSQSSVSSDIKGRLPATLELIFLGLITILVVFIPLGCITASRRGGLATRALKRLTSVYGLLAGSFPDFWLGLILIFFFFVELGWLPGPEGRLSIGVVPPTHITGMYALDAIISGNLTTFRDAVSHLVLPVFTLTFVYGSVIYKYTWSGMSRALRSDYTAYAECLGLPRWKILWYAFRNAVPPVIVITVITLAYLLGGAVLIENVFNLGGVGQYAVQSIISSDYAPIQAFVLVAATFTMFAFLIGDLVYFIADPRVRLRGRSD